MKKVTQKMLSLLLSFAMVFGMVQGAAVPAFAEENGGVTAYYCDSGLFKDSNCTDGPIHVNNWDFRATITNVEIKDNTSAIGDFAFCDCSGIQSVTIPASVTSIGEGAFARCEKLTAITVDASNPSYCSDAGVLFTKDGKTLLAYPAGKAGTSYTIPAGVTVIGNYVFYRCTGLQSITIPASVTTIGSRAFMGCNGLQSVTIPVGVTTIGNNAFTGCNGLQSVTIPAGVTSIGEGAFSNCNGLQSVTIPAGVTTIGNSAFISCTALTSVIIPESVTSIGNTAFYNCSNLAEAMFESAEPPTTVGGSIFDGCASLTAIYVPDETAATKYKAVLNFSDYKDKIQAPETVAKDTEFTCGGLKYKVTDADKKTVEVIFQTEKYTGNITIPEKAVYKGNFLSVTSIGNSAFMGCTGLQSVTIPAGVTSIGGSAFNSCKDLQSVTIPAGVKTIGSFAFSGCTGLQSIPIPASVTSISNSAFDGCTGLQSVTIPASVTSIGCYAFSGCTGLQSVTIPAGVTLIDIRAFSECTGLQSVTISAGVKAIGNYAFSGCTGLQSITIPASVTSIDYCAFSGCSKLTDVALKGKVTSVGVYTFNEGTNTSITFAVSSENEQYYKTLLDFNVMGSTTAKFNVIRRVTAIENLPAVTSVATGTALGALNLPASLTVTVGGAKESVNVTWNSSPEYNSTTTGTYTFTPTLPAGYVLNDGVNTTIKVTVADKSGGNSGSSSSSTSTSTTLPSVITESSINAAANISGASFPSGVTGVALSVIPETSAGIPQGVQGGTADTQGAAVYRSAASNTSLNLIGSPLLYNLKLLDQSGNAVTFTGSVAVKLPLPSGLRGTPRVFRYESGGTFTDMNAAVENGFLTFSTDRFNYYVIAGTGDSITLDTTGYQMPVSGSYQIGVKLTGGKAYSVKFRSTNEKTATVTKLKNGNYQVTGRNPGTAYIMFDVYDNKNKLLTHASVRVDVKTGIRPRGDSARQVGIY